MKLIHALCLSLSLAACGADLSGTASVDPINLEAASTMNDFVWALAQPIGTVVRRTSWPTGITVKRVEAPSTKYPYGRWVYVSAPDLAWLPGARYTPTAADWSANDFELVSAPAVDGEGEPS